MKIVEVVAGIIYNEENKFLVTKRKHESFNGMWEFPGGKIESGETHQATLKREIKEELEIEIEVHDLLTTVEYDYENFHLIMHVYYARKTSGTIKLSVHSEIQWVNENEIDKLEWVPADIQIIDLLKQKNKD